MPRLIDFIKCTHKIKVTCQGKCFQTRAELDTAVAQYIENNSTGSQVAATYGHPIGTWCVSQITDFTGLFLGQQTFNADLNGWDVSGVTTMEE